MENQFKGTKGNWEYTTTNWDDKEIEIWGAERNHPIAKMIECDNTIANALLISKAPEMLEMLIRLSNEIDYTYLAWGNEKGLILSNEIQKLIKEATNV